MTLAPSYPFPLPVVMEVVTQEIPDKAEAQKHPPHMEYIKNKQKTQINGQTKPNKNVATKNRVVVTKGEGARREESDMGKGDQVYGDKWKLNFW